MREQHGAELRKRFLKSLRESEGFSDTPYLDTRGNWTVGYGHDLGRTRPPKSSYTRDELEQMLLRDVASAESYAAKLFEHHHIPIPVPVDNIWYVVVEMAFVLGYSGARQFHRFFSFLHPDRFDLHQASAELKLSKWALEAPNRVEKLRSRLLGDDGFLSMTAD